MGLALAYDDETNVRTPIVRRSGVTRTRTRFLDNLAIINLMYTTKCKSGCPQRGRFLLRSLIHAMFNLLSVRTPVVPPSPRPCMWCVCCVLLMLTQSNDRASFSISRVLPGQTVCLSLFFLFSRPRAPASSRSARTFRVSRTRPLVASSPLI